ncbi:MAG: magnesium and cobalt transport protein CorA [Planctomycetota bacterium]|nr:MAG: magnesium and cobalt transport protein CorA [Planctomycetota bacterium]
MPSRSSTFASGLRTSRGRTSPSLAGCGSKRSGAKTVGGRRSPTLAGPTRAVSPSLGSWRSTRRTARPSPCTPPYRSGNSAPTERSRALVHTVYVHRPGRGLSKLASPDEVRRALGEADATLWVDLEGRSADSDAILGEVFGFHPLAVEDAYKERHRPKVEDYDEYLYLIALGLKPGATLEDVEFFEVDFFLGERFLVTHHSGAAEEVQTTRAAVERDPSLLARGPVWVAHALLDRMVDRLRPWAHRYLEEIDRVEAQVLGGGDPLERIVRLTGGLQHLRRMALVQRDLLGRLARAEFDEVPDEARPFFRDVVEHLAELVDALDVQREELSAVFNAYHSLSSHRMNEIMKLLTLVSTIFLPLTFVVGVYGMNFDNMPELHWAYGYYGIWIVMILLAGVMTLYFRWRRWF